jgi:PAS domain S-box-containing protein
VPDPALTPQSEARLVITRADKGRAPEVTLTLRIDTPIEVDYYRARRHPALRAAPAAGMRWMRLGATPRTLGHGRVIWDGLLTDITDQIRAEAVTRAYETQLAGVLRHLPGAVSRIGLDLEVLYANDTQARWVDSTVEQMIGRRMPEFITPGLMERMLPFLQRAMNGETVVFENRIDRLDGEVRFRHTTLVPERTAQGAVAAIVLFAYDLTELKRTQQELSQQRRHHRPQRAGPGNRTPGLLRRPHGLPNRRLLLDRLQRAWCSAASARTSTAPCCSSTWTTSRT